MKRAAIIKEVKEMIKKAQARMKHIYHSKHNERKFYLRDIVYLKLQPYRQLSVSMRKNFKKIMVPPKCYKEIRVAKKLELPLGSRIHFVFHVSLLKKKIGEHMKMQQTLPKTILN